MSGEQAGGRRVASLPGGWRGTPRAGAARPIMGRMIGYTYHCKCGHTTVITLTSEVPLSLRSDPA